MSDEKLLKPGERIDDLMREGFRLIQNPDLFCFGIDAVLLSDFAKASHKSRVLDLCTGNGVIPILMLARKKGSSYKAIEIQEASADIARRSAKLNEVSDRLEIIQGDIKDVPNLVGRDAFDVVTCNPPYMLNGGGLVNPDDAKALARHEIMCNFDDVARAASRALKVGGKFYFIHRPRRLSEIFVSMKKYNLEPKRIRMVHSFYNKPAVMILVEASKTGGVELIIEPPLVIYKEPGVYTDEVISIY